MRYYWQFPGLILGSLLSAGGSLLQAGPWPPAAGQAGTTAIPRTSSQFVDWANKVTSYQPGGSLDASWKDPAKALGPATDDPAHITGLGSGGSLTVTFPKWIQDGPGPDFAVFENSFSDTFLELAFVEVSADGINFVRFPHSSKTAAPVGSFGSIDPTDLSGLAGKYRQPFGTPFDLAETGLTTVSHVRIVDVIGDGSVTDSDGLPIYDPFPVTGSAGFDLEAIGVIHSAAWRIQQVGTLNATGVNAAAFTHLPDGRWMLGLQGALTLQNAWDKPGAAAVNSGGVEFDPSFLTCNPMASVLLGAGGNFGQSSGLHLLDASVPTPSLSPIALSIQPNFAGAWWPSPDPAKSGWILAGPLGTQSRHGLSYVSADGTVSGPVVTNLSTFSAGLAIDSAGNVFAGRYELPGSPDEPNSEWVLQFTSAQIGQAVSGLHAGTPAALAANSGTEVFRFDSASSLAVDASGRLWASGFKANSLQGFDPATGASIRISPPLPAGSPLLDPLYQIHSFQRGTESYLAFLAAEETGTPGSPVWHGVAPLSALPIPESYSSWRTHHFGTIAADPAAEAGIHGTTADPDGDGLPNLLEYALQTSPLLPHESPLGISRSSGRLVLGFPRNPLRPDLQLTVEAADHPAGPWNALAFSENGQPMAGVAPATPLIVETAGDPVAWVTVRDVVRDTSRPTRFLRLRATLQQP